VSIHPSAIVDPAATIGSDVEVGAFSIVGANVTLGDRCKVHHHAIIEGYTTLGDGCEVFPQAVLGMAPQDLKFSGEETTLVIGKNNIFREMVTVHPGTGNGGGETTIGDNNLFLIGVHIAHDCRIGSRCVFANYVQLAGHIHVADHVNMGGHSAVHHFVSIGRHAFIGGMTRVAADVPPFVILVAARGTRSEVRMINGVGLQRNKFSTDEITALKDAFMKIFARRARLSGTPIRDRVEGVLAADTVNPCVAELCEFLMRSFAHGRHGRYLESLRSDRVHRDSWNASNDFKLTVNVVGDGEVTRTPRANGDGNGAAYELTALASPGWAFSGWDGNLSGSSNPALLTLDKNKTVDATFAKLSNTD